MMEIFDTIGSYINKITTFFHTLFEAIKDSIAEMQAWIEYLPAGLIASAVIIVVLLVIFRVLGR